MSRDAAFALKVSLILLVLAEAIAATGIVPAPHTQLTILFEATNTLYVAGFVLGHVHFLHMMFRPGWREYAMTFAGGIAIFALLVIFDASAGDRSPREILLLLFFGLGSASLVTFTLRALLATGLRQAHGKEMLAISFLLQLFSAVVGTYLHLTSALHPLTFDSLAFHIENTLGFQPSQILALWADAWPPLHRAMVDSYNGILLGFFALFALEATSGKRLPVSTLRLYVFSGIAASILYHLCPITGPRFLFEGYFPHALPLADTVLLETTLVRPTARNGMPSMHLALVAAVVDERGVRGALGARGVCGSGGTDGAGHAGAGGALPGGSGGRSARGGGAAGAVHAGAALAGACSGATRCSGARRCWRFGSSRCASGWKRSSRCRGSSG